MFHKPQTRAYSSGKDSPFFMPGKLSVCFDFLCSVLDEKLYNNKCYNGDLSIASNSFDVTDNYNSCSKYFTFIFDTERAGVHNLIMYIEENIKLYGMTPLTSNVCLRF